VYEVRDGGATFRRMRLRPPETSTVMQNAWRATASSFHTVILIIMGIGLDEIVIYLVNFVS